MNAITISLDKTTDLKRHLSIEEMEEIIGQIVFRDMRITLERDVSRYGYGYTLYLSRFCDNRDNDRKLPSDPIKIDLGWPKTTFKLTGTFSVPELHEPRYFIEFVLRCIKFAEDHEIEENFYYKGQRVFDPHKTEAIEWGHL